MVPTGARTKQARLMSCSLARVEMSQHSPAASALEATMRFPSSTMERPLDDRATERAPNLARVATEPGCHLSLFERLNSVLN
jgi:hypothetical protein